MYILYCIYIIHWICIVNIGIIYAIKLKIRLHIYIYTYTRTHVFY